jgi:hypothetical protein
MKALSALLSVALACVLVAGLQADAAKDAKDKQVTKKGKLVCGKCTLAECDKCTNVLVVKEGDKDVNYFLKDKGNKEAYHKACCAPNSSAAATVTGTLSVEDGKRFLSDTKVTVKKKAE